VAPSQPLDTPLWAFSLAVYGHDGVADECLDLQDRLSLDVNLLLFAAFIGAIDGVRLDSQDIAAASAAIAGWQSEIVHGLRRARRALKPLSSDAGNPLRDANSALRAQLKSAELAAEKIEQTMLWQSSQACLADRPRTDHTQALTANLRGVLAFYGAAETAPRLRDAAVRYAQRFNERPT
jgi:uncharacterized protein (TIGR02444 family)